MFKVGEKVAVCWDGKLGRTSEGLVVANHRNRRVLVVFDTYLDGDPAVKWFRVRAGSRRRGGKPRYIAGHYRDDECKDRGFPGAWYVVHSWAEIKRYAPSVAQKHTLYTEKF